MSTRHRPLETDLSARITLQDELVQGRFFEEIDLPVRVPARLRIAFIGLSIPGLAEGVAPQGGQRLYRFGGGVAFEA